ncbi:hypothetical protein M1394_00035 [Candidatus Marsarchaeota archaeon]|nr:hypothetical protein [Candidatus Marsarchaeota archaeon]
MKSMIPEAARLKMWMFFSIILFVIELQNINNNVLNAREIIDSIGVAIFVALIIIAVMFTRKSRKKGTVSLRNNLILLFSLLAFLFEIIGVVMRTQNVNYTMAGMAAVVLMIINRFV